MRQNVYPPDLSHSRVLTESERTASRYAFFKDRDDLGDLWLFAYGSLMWRPEIAAVERCQAKAYGFHRGLYLWSRVSRGTPACPGLVLGLDRGGSCHGIAYRLDKNGIQDALARLWTREMPMESYKPEWMTCHLHDGRRIRAFGFVVLRDVPSYAGRLPDSLLWEVLRQAKGKDGTTYDYIVNTAMSLRKMSMPALALEGMIDRYHRHGHGKNGPGLQDGDDRL
jgi:cation transport protein ChaC